MIDNNLKYIKNKNKKKYKESQKDFFRKEKLTIKEVSKGIIFPAYRNEQTDRFWSVGGVLDKDKHFVEESATSYFFGGNYEIYNENIKYIDEEVIFFGPFIEHWGHFICDQISRLWYILENPNKYKIAYCGWDFGNKRKETIRSNYLELLELIGIKKEQLIEVQRPLQFKKIIIPEFSFKPGFYYTNEYCNLIKKIVDEALKKDISVEEKIYFTRQNFKFADKEYGEKDLVEIFIENGFVVKSPENLSLIEQINILNKAKTVAAITGSITHNYMFCMNKETNLILLNKFGRINRYQSIIDNISLGNITYIDSYKSFFTVLFGMGPFILNNNNSFKKFCLDNNYKYRKPNFDLNKYKWYFKEYFKTYSSKENKELLNSQKSTSKFY